MSTMRFHDPEPGWQTRWPRQAVGMILRDPVILLIYLLVMPASGLLTLAVSSATSWTMVIIVMNTMIEVSVTSLVAVLTCRRLYRADGYAAPSLSGEMMKEPCVLALRGALVVAVMGLGLVILTGVHHMEGDRDIRQAVLSSYDDGFLFVVFAGVFGHAVTPLAASGTFGDEARAITAGVDAKIAKAFPYRRSVLVIVAALSSLHPLLAVAIFPTLIACFYVATREIVAGPGAGSREFSGSVSFDTT